MFRVVNIILVITTFIAESELCLRGTAAIQMNWKSNVMCHHYQPNIIILTMTMMMMMIVKVLNDGDDDDSYDDQMTCNVV